MDRVGIGESIKKLSALNCGGMHLSDFLLTWERPTTSWRRCSGGGHRRHAPE
jgi:hypothetical protein